MGKYALLVAAALLPFCLRPADAQAGVSPPTTGAGSSVPIYTVEPPNRVIGYTAWDDDYFYIAVQVSKPTLHGTNTQPFSNPRADDSVLIELQTDDDHSTTKPTAHTVVVAASAVGGAQLYSGPQQTPLFNGIDDFRMQLTNIIQNEQDPAKRDLQRTALLGKLIKFQVMPQGIRRATGTFMPGYTAELAIPWSDLGGKPAPGARMGFSVTAQSTVPDSPALQSLSPQVHTPGDLDNPSLWGEIVFGTETAPSHPALVICPRVFSNKPVIDGVVNVGEWNRVTAFSIEPSGANSTQTTATDQARTKPTFTPHPSRAALPLPALGPLPSMAIHMAQPLPHLIIARYDYHYQADPRNAAPIQGVLRGDGASALVHHPLEGAGPWFSYNRADWHRQQLVNARQAGIDVILPVYPAALRDRQRYADKGLLVLVTALQNLRDSGQDYPQVGLFLDTSGLSATDVSAPTEEILFAAVRDFYRHLPTAFRFTVSLSAANGGRAACPIFLSDARVPGAFAEGWVERLRARFAREFDDADLLILGTADFKPQTPLDGYFADTSDKGFQFVDGGWIKAASVGAGYDTGAADVARYRPRRNGDTYRTDWAAAIGKRPDWVLLDGWNDYSVAAEIAPTFESGYSTADITREYSHRWIGSDRRAVKILQYNAPRRMTAGHTYAIEVRAQNSGVESWGAPPLAQIPAAFAYRWLRGGQTVGEGVGTPLSTTVTNGQDVNGLLSVRTVGSNGAPLSAGDYTLEVGLTAAPKSARTVTLLGEGAPASTLQIPVSVTNDSAYAAKLIHSTLPAILESGSVYPVRVALRNDGAKTWRKADGARITLRLYRTELDGAEPKETLAEIADATAMLTADVPPGQIAEVSVEAALVGPDGKPLPPWSQGNAWTYTTRWEVADNNGGALTAPVAAGVVNSDFGVHFVFNGTPAMLPAERRLPVRLILQNDGPRTWVHDAVRVGYHWYYEDGSEFVFDDETTPLKKDVPPGDKTEELLAYVTPPPNDGLYYLVWDLKVGDTWASTSDSSRVGDEIVQPVHVIDGQLRFVDLTTAFNLDGISDDDAPQDGDFDGQGRAFSAALLPPYAIGDIVPVGVWQSSAPTGPDSQHKVSFRWGSKDLKQKNFVVCRGQRIDLGKATSTCRKLHILAAATGKDVSTSVKLVFEEPTGESEDLYAFSADRWDKPEAHPDQVAFLARRHNTSQGAEAGAVALYQYTLIVNEPGKLKAIELPNEPALKIAAITIEK